VPFQCGYSKISASHKASVTLDMFSKAVNGPLQQRTTVLDLDFSRANTFPTDYDTDVESAWSNLSRIAPPLNDKGDIE
jgi:hypothetical protein